MLDWRQYAQQLNSLQMKSWKKILIGLLVIALAVAAYGFYLYNKKPADVRTLTAKYDLTAVSLSEDYNKDEPAADKKYVDKVIAVRGKVAEVKIEPTGQGTIILDGVDPMTAITCSFYDDEASSLKKIKKGDEIVVKGKCTG